MVKFLPNIKSSTSARDGKLKTMLTGWRIAGIVTLLILFIILSNAAPIRPYYGQESNGPRYKPIVFIPGMGGNQLEAVVEGPVRPGCVTYSYWYRIWMDIWTFFKDGVDCWADNMKLTYDPVSGRSSNAPGVKVRVPGWGSTETVEYVDSSWTAWLLGNLGAYVAHLVTELVARGYERNISLRAAPYDFRLAPHSQPEYFTRLQQLIEETHFINDRQPILLVAHSLGGIFATYFLSNVTQEWKDRYIAGLVTINTPWAGTVMSTIMFTTGYNWEIDSIDRLIIRGQQRTYETGILVLPKSPTWEDDEVLVSVGNRKFTVANYDEFFTAINYTAGIDLMRVANTHQYEQRHPSVPVHCLYSSGIPTTIRLHYEDETQFPDADPIHILGSGDGTVNLKSLQACRKWNSHSTHPVQMQHFVDLKHNDILSSNLLLDSILTIAQI